MAAKLRLRLLELYNLMPWLAALCTTPPLPTVTPRVAQAWWCAPSLLPVLAELSLFCRGCTIPGTEKPRTEAILRTSCGKLVLMHKPPICVASPDKVWRSAECEMRLSIESNLISGSD